MLLFMPKILLIIFFVSTIFISNSYSELINKIEVSGNNRVSSETIKMFSEIATGDDIKQNDINEILKQIYDSNFFNNVQVIFQDGVLRIFVEESPVIQNITYKGIKADKIKKPTLSELSLKPRVSYNEILLKRDKEKILSSLKNFGYYFSTVDVLTENLDDNKINITFDINLGKKAKIKKIKFIGNKIFKDKKLKNIIISEEFKFWKFISGKKYLNENLIELDKRLLKNFYLNKGFYNIEIKTSFAKLIDNNDFELIYNINAGNKIFFNDLNLIIPADYDKNNFSDLINLLESYKGEIYSLNGIEKILDKIDSISLNEQYSSIKATVEEKIFPEKINIDFIINETEKYFVEKINIFGNNVTQENVIRNQFEIDEGDPFNEILQKKSVNNIKSLNIFKKVESKVLNSQKENNKIINISVEEKPTGEILAGAGVGTGGGTLSFGVKENNFLGKGIGLNTNVNVSGDSIKGIFTLKNPNFQNSDKSLSFSLESSEYDNLKTFGYKTNKNGFFLGTEFEYYDDLFLGLKTSNFYEKIETDSTASVRQKSQAGSYYDSFINLSFNYDKRNQKFQTSEGFKSYYSLNLPILSKTNTLTNIYNFQYFTELYDQNISTISFYIKNSLSISGDDIKLSERSYIPSSKLRGFESGKVGAKDSGDYIGGNYVTAINFSSTIPQILENSETTDFLIFMDIANIWGVDYDSSLNDSSKIRSSIGLGVDWFTVVGPLNFSLAYPITKDSNDITESFRFNLGTTF